MSDAPVRTEQGWVLPLAGWPVQSCCLGAQFIFQFYRSRDESAQINIEGPAQLTRGAQTYTLDPADLPSLLPAFKLVAVVIDTMIATDAGTLRVAFADGHVLTVPPDPNQGTWQVIGPGGWVAYSMEAGYLGMWPPLSGG